MIDDELAQVCELVSRGALFVVNHSAGKDSQAMLIFLRRHVPAHQLLIIHADLGEVEWPGNVEHIQRYAGDLPLVIAKPVRGFIQMVEDRFANRPEVPSFPNKKNRQCTSDLKRGPIEREIRRYLKAHPEFGGLVVNCMGMRAQESTDRAKLVPFALSKKKGHNVARKVNRKGVVTNQGREWYEWLPIHAMSTLEVFASIAAAGEEPHPVYAEGMTRLSCVFCIMASVGDLQTAARLNPTLYVRYVMLERKTGYTLSMSGKTLEQICGVPVNDNGEINLIALAA